MGHDFQGSHATGDGCKPILHLCSSPGSGIKGISIARKVRYLSFNHGYLCQEELISILKEPTVVTRLVYPLVHNFSFFSVVLFVLSARGVLRYTRRASIQGALKEDGTVRSSPVQHSLLPQHSNSILPPLTKLIVTTLLIPQSLAPMLY